MENILGIFVKYPEAGFVKTRLARDIGDEAAARLYRALVESALSRTRDDRRYSRTVFFTPEERWREIAAWLRDEDLELRSQKGDDLGERMSAAFDSAFSRGARKAVIIGTDVPMLDAETVGRAFAALDGAPLVIGPSKDGGYYLIGLREPRPELFRGVGWGGEDVCRLTLDITGRLGLDYVLLEELVDVDDAETLGEFSQLLRSGVTGVDSRLRRIAAAAAEIVSTACGKEAGSGGGIAG